MVFNGNYSLNLEFNGFMKVILAEGIVAGPALCTPILSWSTAETLNSLIRPRNATNPSAGSTYTPWRFYGFGNIALLKKVADDRTGWRVFKNFLTPAVFPFGF